MRHSKHRFQLGVKKEHRFALMANLAAALLEHGRIQTTKAKAKALRPFIEPIITLAKKAALSDNSAQKLHYRRLALARVRNKQAVHKLFDERAQEFLNRNGGYTRIYKLVPRRGDAAEMALIELIDASDEGYKKQGRRKSKAKKSAPKQNTAKAEKPAEEGPVVEAEEHPAEVAEGAKA
ncbi:MAG TPA: 50S ribosomal protein L17 [Opitutae bacterium]|nr:50S ribosomal protein L17 [Opitutae bacterium]